MPDNWGDLFEETQGAVSTKEETKNELKELPQFRVLLHNDDVNTFDHVIMTIMMVTPLQLEDAVKRTIEAHESGLALLLITHKELAELYQEQFHTRNLLVTIEPEEE